MHDISGRVLRSLLEGTMPAGEHEIVWDGRDGDGRAQASGVYFVAFRAGDHAEQLKLGLIE